MLIWFVRDTCGLNRKDRRRIEALVAEQWRRDRL